MGEIERGRGKGRVKGNTAIDKVTGRRGLNDSEKVMRGRRINARERMETEKSNGKQVGCVRIISFEHFTEYINIRVKK
jgi:hypothetical protein